MANIHNTNKTTLPAASLKNLSLSSAMSIGWTQWHNYVISAQRQDW